MMEGQINVSVPGVAELRAGNSKENKLRHNKYFTDCCLRLGLTVLQLCSLIVLQIFSLIIWHCCWVIVSVTV